MLFQIFIPNTGFGSCAGLFENDWAVLFHLIVPKIITKKSQWKPVVSNIQITLKKNKQVLNDIRAFKNASCIFLLLKINGNFDTHFHWDKTETNTGSLKKHNQTKTSPQTTEQAQKNKPNSALFKSFNSIFEKEAQSLSKFASRAINRWDSSLASCFVHVVS